MGIRKTISDAGHLTKAKAQEYIILDMDAERAAKEKFLKTTVPAWLEKAKANGRLWHQK